MKFSYFHKVTKIAQYFLTSASLQGSLFFSSIIPALLNLEFIALVGFCLGTGFISSVHKNLDHANISRT
jgi:hypothetical protein